jgi:hypothetical protein
MTLTCTHSIDHYCDAYCVWIIITVVANINIFFNPVAGSIDEGDRVAQISIN